MSKEAMKLALDALKQIDEAMPVPVAKLAQAALREALAEQPAQQEPGRNHWEDGDVFERIGAMKNQPAQRKPLTDEQIDRLWSQSLADTESETWLPLREFARAIEAAHGIKGDA